MNDAEVKLMLEDLKYIGGQYAQAKLVLKMLPQDIKTSLYSKSRRKQNVLVRRKIIVILRDRYELTFPAIAELLGYKEHTSVVHHYYRAKRA